MKKKIIIFIGILLFIWTIYYILKDDSIPLEEFRYRIDKKLPEIEKINFRYYRKLNGNYYFSNDIISASITYNFYIFKNIYNNKTNTRIDLAELPKGFLYDLKLIEDISNEIKIYDIFKDNQEKRIDFVFNLDLIKTESIYGWNKNKFKNISKYDGYIAYDPSNKLSNDSEFVKLKNNWYFMFYERRPN